MERGKLIVIEGTDCSGKETQTSLLVQRLSKMGEKIERLSFPMYDTPTGRIVGGPYLGKSYIGDSCFSGCSSLTSLDVNNFVVTNAKNMMTIPKNNDFQDFEKVSGINRTINEEEIRESMNTRKKGNSKNKKNKAKTIKREEKTEENFF